MVEHQRDERIVNCIITNNRREFKTDKCAIKNCTLSEPRRLGTCHEEGPVNHAHEVQAVSEVWLRTTGHSRT
jgi:hypothetical protein